MSAGLMRANLAMLVILFLSACGTTENKTQSAPKSFTVEIAQMKFNPAELKVHKGDTVIFLNHDMVTHDITEERSKSWSSSQLPANASWSLVVDKSAYYFCSLHPVMKGKITVEE